MTVHFHTDPSGSAAVVTLDRSEVAHAIDRPTADALAGAFRRFEADASVAVAVLVGAGGTSCAGADPKALRMGLASRRVPPGQAQSAALAKEIAARPREALRHDRLSSYEQWSLAQADALRREYDHGMQALRSRELAPELERYPSGSWRSP